MKIKSIQTRLLLALLPLLLIALCVLAGTSYYLSRESLSKSIGQTVMAVGMDYKVMATQKSVVSDPLVSKATGKPAVVLAVPVTNQGRMTEVFVGTFSMDRLSAMIKDLKFIETGYGQLVDDSGMLIAHPRGGELTGKLNLLQKKINPELKLAKSELDDQLINLFKTAVQSGKQLIGHYSFVDDVSRIAVFTPLELPGGQRWILTVAAPRYRCIGENDADYFTAFDYCRRRLDFADRKTFCQTDFFDPRRRPAVSSGRPA